MTVGAATEADESSPALASASDRPLKIGVIQGDAAGADHALHIALAALTRAGVAVEATWHDIGWQRYLRDGQVLPAGVIELLHEADAILCGSPPASGSEEPTPGLLERGIVFGLRREFGLAINVREFRSADEALPRVVVVRENSEGLYFSEGMTLHVRGDYETSIEIASSSYSAVARTLRYGFERAHAEHVPLTVAHKTNVLVHSGKLWTRALEDIAPEFPDVRIAVENIDTCCGQLAAGSRRYGVIVSDNVFGDILSDVVCGVFRAVDHSCSVELAVGGGPSLFEPMHGPQGLSAGVHRVSPFGTLSAVAALAEHVGHARVGRALGLATFECLRTRPADAALLDAISAATARRLQ